MNWKITKIKDIKQEVKSLVLIMVLLIATSSVLFLNQMITWNADWDRIESMQEYEEYKLLENELKEKKRVKIAMFRELDAVSWCESRHQDDAQNPTSSALGRFQIINSTLELCERNLGRKLDRMNPEDSWDCAVYLYLTNGLRDWNASKGCWAKELNE